MSFFGYILAAVFVQNLVFSGMCDIGLVTFTAKRSDRLIAASASIFVFSFLAALPLIPLDRSLATAWSSFMPLRGLIVCVIIALLYFIFSKLIEKLPKLCELLGNNLRHYALSAAVISVPLNFSGSDDISFSAVLATSLGAALGFAGAVLLIIAGMKHASSPAIPKAFRGTPALLIYIGLLSMIFMCFR